MSRFWHFPVFGRPISDAYCRKPYRFQTSQKCLALKHWFQAFVWDLGSILSTENVSAFWPNFSCCVPTKYFCKKFSGICPSKLHQKICTEKFLFNRKNLRLQNFQAFYRKIFRDENVLDKFNPEQKNLNFGVPNFLYKFQTKVCILAHWILDNYYFWKSKTLSSQKYSTRTVILMDSECLKSGLVQFSDTHKSS